MKKLMLIFLLPWVGNAAGQIPWSYREELGLQRHEERLRAAGVPVTEEMREYVKNSGRLSSEQQADLSAFLKDGNPLQIEWLVCESSDAFAWATSIEDRSPAQLLVISQAFLDYAPRKFVAGDTQDNGMWNVKPVELATRIAEIAGVTPPGKTDYFSRDTAVAWLMKTAESLQSSPATSPEIRAACEELLESLEAPAVRTSGGL